MASGKDSRTKVVLARKIEKQGLGSTPELKMILMKLKFLTKSLINKVRGEKNAPSAAKS